MDDPGSTALGLGVALGIGLLVGIEREKSKGTGQGRGAAGVRTFALAALLGGVGYWVAEVWGVLVVTGIVGAYGAAAYLRSESDDPGLTTEMALVLTCVAGALAQTEPALAGALGVLVALLLVSRSWLHAIVREKLSQQEIADGLLLAGAALVVLPLIPDRTIDPFGVINPRVVWTLAVLVMLINAGGYISLRAFGARMGLPVAGLAGGFISSIATIGSMGSRARSEARLGKAAVAGAAMSSVATPVQLAIVLGVAHLELMYRLLPSMIGAGLVAALYGLLFTFNAVKHTDNTEARLGRAFEPRVAIVFAVTVSLVIFVSAALSHWFGAPGGVLGIAAAGFADSHSSAVSGASLLKAGALSMRAAELAVLLAFTTNSVTKAVAAWITGGRSFALQLIPGLMLMLAAAWAALLIPLPELGQK